MGLLQFLFPASKSGGLLHEDGQEDEKDTFLPSHRPLRPLQSSRGKRLELCLLIVSGTILILGLAIAVLAINRSTGVSMPFESGWVTKIGPPYPVLSIEQVHFDAGLALNEKGDLIRTSNVEGSRQYVGEPSDEIDSNWELLIPSDTNITREEAQQIGGEFYFYPGTDIATIEISSFHLLHCLDMVRQSVQWEHYWPNGVDKRQQVHVDHCIDAIRQYIQCHMDLTPINLVWSKNRGGILPDFKQVHTCRSYREAHEWVLRRNIANYESGIGDKGVADDARQTLQRLGWE
ncbi:hypothetical protein PFICI_05739 [Pestalotiopsis fici W106-1]|uniref:Tat pathway signal sequence n=1 Tax=Pestalotiopsis fici (strain W106-1 / CGMCC3.15140) TaxID=1229662 RepID=W3XCN6_PESFW|nr:uncharacterized protein PFICI_05739 [Pestalotiopsis fici W106-1]ETS83863.1 hypothetical protein PFICI_05739 [Pestalotiopsis fici W106-1]